MTRAQSNLVIADTDPKLSCPMYNYFQWRAVIDAVRKGSSEVLSSICVFGNKSTAEEWCARVEYYLKNAKGDRQRTALRLAAKCLGKAGDVEHKEYALACLALVEIDKQENKKKRGKPSAEVKSKLHNIIEQLISSF